MLYQCLLLAFLLSPVPIQASIVDQKLVKSTTLHFNDTNIGFSASVIAKRGDPEILPPQYWRLAKNQDEIDSFRTKYNLTIVTCEPQDAALLPSWPQALLQYFLINPFLNFEYGHTRTHTTEFTRETDWGRTVHSYGKSRSFELGLLDVIQYLVAPPCFIAWIISFARIQSSEKATAGWISVLGWGTWICLAGDLMSWSPILGLPPTLLALFQWVLSLTVIIQRWTRSIGTVAYLITDTHWCTPHNGDYGYLQSGIRSRPYRIIQTATFVSASVFTPLSIQCGAKAKNAVNSAISAIAFAELVYSALVATKGIPMIVSGNCLLLELNPRKGYLDSSISTTWKALSGFMGF